MACRGVFFAITEDQKSQLLSASSDEERLSIILNDIEEQWDENWLAEMDKAWDAVHRCITDGTLKCRGKHPMEKCVLGGVQLYKRSDWIISFIECEELDELIPPLKEIQKEEFRKKYFALKKTQKLFGPQPYEGPHGEEDFEYSWAYFEEMRNIFVKANQGNRHIIFTVDQ